MGPPASVRTAISRIRKRGEVLTVAGWDGQAAGVIVLADILRDHWRDDIETLAADERRVVVITGDDPRVAQQFENHPAVDVGLRGRTSGGKGGDRPPLPGRRNGGDGG